MHRQHRHPALETAVFAAALLLAVFIARELWRRRPMSPQAVGQAADRAVGEELSLLPQSYGQATSPYGAVGRTETAVTGVAPIKLSRAKRRRPKPEAVPVPKS